VEVTLLRERSVPEYQEVLLTLLEDIENLSKISNNLLSLALATTDAGALKFKQIRVDDLLFAAREDLIGNFPEYHVEINLLSLSEDVRQLCVMGNEQLLRTAILNLFENGCKYSDNNSVEVSFETLNDEIELIFRNTGAGIPESEIAQIFRPFYRASNVKEQRGSGLGLALTQKIIELHKGVIEVRSVVGIETSVKVLLPILDSF